MPYFKQPKSILFLDPSMNVNLRLYGTYVNILWIEVHCNQNAFTSLKFAKFTMFNQKNKNVYNLSGKINMLQFLEGFKLMTSSNPLRYPVWWQSW